MDYKTVSKEKRRICDAMIFEEVHFEVPIFNSSLLHNVPINYENGIPYNERDFLVTNGYHIFLDSIMECCKHNVLLNERVTKVNYSTGGVQIKSEKGTTINADYVICTIPLGVLKTKDVIFEPPFSDEKQEAIDGLGMGFYEKIYVIFPTMFWNDSSEVLIYISENETAHDSIMTWGLNLDHKKYFPGSKMLTFHSMGDTAKRVAGQPLKKTLDEVNAIMVKMFGNNATTANKIHVTNWTYNRNSYGSWSAMPYGYSKRKYEIARKNEGRLHFAGEHTSVTHNYGFVHSAYLTGKETAEKIFNEINQIYSSFPPWRSGCPHNG
jgi:polyamine oxidase